MPGIKAVLAWRFSLQGNREACCNHIIQCYFKLHVVSSKIILGVADLKLTYYCMSTIIEKNYFLIF